MNKPEVMCPICNEQFTQKRPNMRFCSRRCANISANRAARVRAGCVPSEVRTKPNPADLATGCPYNGEIICDMRKCSKCGWNPEVAKRRTEALYG